LIWRISERRAFQNLARTGRKARTQTLWCSYVNDPSAAPLRVAFAIGKSVGPATKRNRIRRRLRAILQTASRQTQMNHGWLLVGVRPAVTERTFADLQNEMIDLLQRVAPRPSERR